MYEEFLQMYIPNETRIIGFADNALVMCVTKDVEILKLMISDSLWLEKRWLDSKSLEMVPEETKAVLITDMRYFKYPKIVLGEHEVAWSRSIKYLRVQLDQRLSFGEHLQISRAKTTERGLLRHWRPQECKKKTGGKSGALKAALCSFQKRLSLTQRSVTENSVIIDF